MTAEADHWGVPSTRCTVMRARVLDLLSAGPGDALLVVAPSGWGKTVAAAQFAGSCGSPVLWVSLRGDALDYAGLLSRVSSAAQRFIPGHPQAAGRPAPGSELVEASANLGALLSAFSAFDALVVLDDLRPNERSSVAEMLGRLVSDLGALVGRFLITTRELGDDDYGRLQDTVLIDTKDLGLSPMESELLAEVCGAQAVDGDLESLRRSCSGHPALMRMALSEMALDGAGAVDLEPTLASVSLVERLVAAHLDDDARTVLEVASLLESGSLSDLSDAGVQSPERTIQEISDLLPLVRIVSTGIGRELTFSVHELVSECVVRRAQMRSRSASEAVARRALQVLATRQDWARAEKVLARLLGRSDRLAFVRDHGDALLESGDYEVVLRLLGAVPLQNVMSEPRCLLQWSRALLEAGEPSGAVAKAAAAIRLARHEGDAETLDLAVLQRAQAWLDQGKSQEAIDDLEWLLRDHAGEMSPRVRCDALITYSSALVVTNRRILAAQCLRDAELAASELSDSQTRLVARLDRVKAYAYPLWWGDHSRGVRETAPLLDVPATGYLARQTLMGNLAWMLLEIGRLSRAESLLEHVLSAGNPLLAASYSPLLGLIQATRGNSGGSQRQMDLGRLAAARYGDTADLHVNRLYEACIVRAQGDPEAALDLAERSFEGLSRNDFLGFSRLAAAEVACSLLALGDTPGARGWVGPTSPPDDDANKYHELCAAMVLAVADCRQGMGDQAVDRLRPFSDYIRSDSANWRMAMYCRVFPELLWLLSSAVGPEHLPIHMLRMVLPEHVERALRIAKDHLDRPDWEALGKRALGNEQFSAYVDRHGRPICRVRLFGGLEVVADERTVRERDWKKRKARLLFAMLVVRRGQDIARDQILDHLWPDLPEDRARNNFYVAWSMMKNALVAPEKRADGCPYVESARGRCRIVRDSVRSDVDEFEELMLAAREAEAAGRLAEAIAALQELMSVYRGDLLPGDIYDDWFSVLRDKYRFEFIDAMAHGAELLLAADDPCEALVFARTALGVDQYREDLYQLALRCHIAAGQRSAAIETFIQCKTQLADELGLDPSKDTIGLYRTVLAMEERPRYDSYGLNPE